MKSKDLETRMRSLEWFHSLSVLLDPSFDLFDREVEKLVSISASVAAAAFTHAVGEPVHFDSRVWMGAAVQDVVDYFSWRQADAARWAAGVIGRCAARAGPGGRPPGCS